jgi:hypothetical protein
MGDRAVLGQAPRNAELLAPRLLEPLGWLMPRAVRPIRADAVASSFVESVLEGRPGVRILKSGDMQAN